MSTSKLYDPEEWLAGEQGLIRRCQHGRADSWSDGRLEQCAYPVMRGQRTCADHGGVPVAKLRLQSAMVPMTEAMIEIALDPREKTADRLAAMNSAMDRAGGLGRTVAQPEPEVRSALLARLEQAAQEHLDKQGESAVLGTMVAAQEPAKLEAAHAGPAPSGTPWVDQEGSPILVDVTSMDPA